MGNLIVLPFTKKKPKLKASRKWLRNYYGVVTKNIAEMLALQHLTLDSSKLPSRLLQQHKFNHLMTETIGMLTALQALVVINNNFLIIVPNSIGDLRALRELNLSDNELMTVPNSIGDLEALQKLVLSNNRLSTLSESFGNLRALRELNLSENELTTVPNSIGDLEALQKLVLSHNRLRTLPESFGGLTALQKLVLSHNGLTTLPESFGGLTALQELNLSYNPLHTLSENISYLMQLSSLELCECRRLRLISPALFAPRDDDGRNLRLQINVTGTFVLRKLWLPAEDGYHPGLTYTSSVEPGTLYSPSGNRVTLFHLREPKVYQVEYCKLNNLPPPK